MRGQRVLVSGMGSELGSLVASLLEREPWVGAVEGIDIDPPRRRLHRAVFHRIEPHQRQRVFDVVTAFNPHVVVHVAIWEPDARVDTAKARNLTDDAAATILGSAAECSALQHLVIRSAAEVYGRSRGALTRPDESAPTEPTSTFGRMALALETIAADIGARTGATVGAVRLSPVVGPPVPSPLGRPLRLPAVPFSVLADPPFAVIEDTTVARAFVAAAQRRLAEPVNVVANGAVTALQAARRGHRIPIPLVGPDWWLARTINGLLGA